MSVFKEKMKQDIVNPAVHNRRNNVIIAEVTKSDERNNVCSIKFIDKDSSVSNKDNIPVRLYNETIIDWFPSEGDYVVAQYIGEEIEIVSKSTDSYAITARTKGQTRNDILPSTFGSTMSGYIF